ncbi:hypothetical protein FB446DRAFT_654082, partial [Lentinula raphanica]
MGGRNLLDLLARNEAITVTWLQSYLDLSESRATWTYVADALIAMNIPNKYENTDEHSRINMFLQSWNTQTSKLPIDLKNMIEVAKKYGTRLEGMAFSREILREMPAWYHIETPDMARTHNNKHSRCLRENHGVKSVGDLEEEAKKLRTPRHSRRRNCRCVACVTARAQLCQSPFKCFSRANEIMRAIPPKWNPMGRQPSDENVEVNPNLGNEIIFDKQITTEGTLADAFRIFTEGETTNMLYNTQAQQEDAEGPRMDIYTDGSCINNGNDDAKAGAGIFCPQDETINRAIRLPETIPQTNQSGEIVSIKEAASITHP